MANPEKLLRAAGYTPGANAWWLLMRPQVRTVQLHGDNYTLTAPLSDLAALLAGTALAPAEVEALTECANAMGLLAKASSKEANQERARGHARTLQGLLNRMGAVPSPSTPETREES